MGDRKTKEDYVQQFSTSIFVTNFPDQFTFRDLWRTCQVYGRVIDAFIPNRRSKTGTRFGFVRFIQVKDVDRLVGNLCTIWVGRLRLHANVARFQRPSLNSASNVQRSYVEKKSVGRASSKVYGSNDSFNSYGLLYSAFNMTQRSYVEKKSDGLAASKQSLWGEVKIHSFLMRVLTAVTGSLLYTSSFLIHLGYGQNQGYLVSVDIEDGQLTQGIFIGFVPKEQRITWLGCFDFWRTRMRKTIPNHEEYITTVESVMEIEKEELK
ncbi:nucleotide-binding alpha-beta plait domain-containing protein [Tanacetum coccineum]